MAGRRVEDRKIIVRYSDEFTKAQIRLKIIKLLIDEKERRTGSNGCS